MSIAVRDFIDEVLKRWPPPRAWSEEQEEAWSDDVIAEFANEKEPIFDQALNVLKRQSRPYSGTPRIEDVIKAVKLAAKEVAAQRRAGMLNLDGGDTFDRAFPWDPPPEQRPWTKEGRKLAYDLIQTEAGRQAAREGWIKPYWEYVLTYHKAPPASEYGRLRAAAITMDYCQELLRQGKAGAKEHVAAARLRMLESDRLAEIANGRQMPSRQDYWEQHGALAPKAPVKSSPPSNYADTNSEEGRGWKGVTA